MASTGCGGYTPDFYKFPCKVQKSKLLNPFWSLFGIQRPKHIFWEEDGFKIITRKQYLEFETENRSKCDEATIDDVLLYCENPTMLEQAQKQKIFFESNSDWIPFKLKSAQ